MLALELSPTRYFRRRIAQRLHLPRPLLRENQPRSSWGGVGVILRVTWYTVCTEEITLFLSGLHQSVSLPGTVSD